MQQNLICNAIINITSEESKMSSIFKKTFNLNKMKTKHFFGIVLIVFMCGLIWPNNVNAQQKTAYQQELVVIIRKYVKIIMIRNGSWTANSENEIKYIDDTSLAKILTIGLPSLTPEEIAKCGEEMNEAKKLMTDVDRQREQAREEEEKKNEYLKTNRGNLERDIKDSFENWNQKGEFEKQGDFEERLQKQSQSKFVEICLEKIKEKIENFSNYDLNKELLKYDSENEYFPILFKFNNIEWQNKLKISISDAENFKNNWQNFSWVKNDYDWCFVDNKLLPSKIVLEGNNTKCSFDLPIQNQQEILISFNSLGIENPYLKNYVCNYHSSVEEIRKLKQFSDSTEFVAYNNKLKELIKSYNQKLLENPNNFNTIGITGKVQIDSVCIGNKKMLEANFKEKSLSIENTYEHINEIFNEYKEVSDIIQNNNAVIKTMDFQTGQAVSSGKTLAKYAFAGITGIDLGINNDNLKDQNAKQIYQMLNQIKEKAYYFKVVDSIVEINNKLNKEYKENGNYFESKTEFFETFISSKDNYKNILKEKKLKKK